MSLTPVIYCRRDVMFLLIVVIAYLDFRGVSYVTWENQDKVFEKTEVGELKQNGCDGHGYSL